MALAHRCPDCGELQEAEKVRWEEQKKLMQQDAYNKQEVAKYNNDLATKRQELEHLKQRERNQELVQLQVRRADWRGCGA